jgi:hypothetical protein
MEYYDALDLLQLLYAYLLDFGFPDLFRHPGRSPLGLIYLHPLSCEQVYFLCAPLPELDIRIAPVGCLQGCLSGRRSGKDANLIALGVSQGESSLLGYDRPSCIVMDKPS